MSVCLAIDVMGGDDGPQVTMPAVVEALALHPTLRVCLVGDENAIRAYDLPWERVDLIHTPESIAMDDAPATVLRKKKNSSMHLALQAVRDKRADACVSAGNTGALMAVSRLVLKMAPGIERPAILGRMPAEKGGQVWMLDLGANVDNTADHLAQFAQMGHLAARAMGCERPRIALLNIGHEAVKGNEVVKQAAQLLQSNDTLHYVGFCESHTLFHGDVDVIVCDGFVGNAVLKACEGSVRFVLDQLKQALTATLWGQCVGALLKLATRHRLSRLQPAKHNGAFMLGLRGLVVKSHGGTTSEGFRAAMEVAMAGVEDHLCAKVAAHGGDPLTSKGTTCPNDTLAS